MFLRIIDKIKDLVWRRRLARFALVGGMNTLFGILAYPIIYYVLSQRHIHYIVALPLSYIVSISFSYMTNKFLVFRSYDHSLTEFVRFSSFYVICFAINLIVLPVCVELLHINPVVAQTGVAIATAMGSYGWHVIVTFGNRAQNAAGSDV